jgi:hypothetical protein
VLRHHLQQPIEWAAMPLHFHAEQLGPLPDGNAHCATVSAKVAAASMAAADEVGETTRCLLEPLTA